MDDIMNMDLPLLLEMRQLKEEELENQARKMQRDIDAANKR